MKIKLIITGIFFTLIFANLSGCMEEKTSGINVPLNTLALTSDDIGEECNIIDEIHVTEPYTVEEDLILGGWYVLEKYEIWFSFGEYDMAQTLVKLNSNEKASEFIEVVGINLSGQFPEAQIEPIGEDLYFGKNTTIGNLSMYLLCFKIENVVVILFGTVPTEDTLINYANIMENNLNEASTEN